MKLADYPDNWGPSIDFMLRHQKGFNASDFEKAAAVAESIGDHLFAKMLLNLAADRAAEHLLVWGHCG